MIPLKPRIFVASSQMYISFSGAAEDGKGLVLPTVKALNLFSKVFYQ
jgi:hypothetical protein